MMGQWAADTRAELGLPSLAVQTREHTQASAPAAPQVQPGRYQRRPQMPAAGEAIEIKRDCGGERAVFKLPGQRTLEMMSAGIFNALYEAAPLSAAH
jgi:hypothetical protein